MSRAKGILMISYYYPPIKSMGSIRAYALSHEWIKSVSQINVVTTSNRNRLAIDRLSINEKINIYIAKTWDYRSITSLFQKNTHYSESTKQTWISKLIIKLLNSFPFNRYVGEGGIIYEERAFKIASQLIESKNINVVFSSFRPYTDHMVARRLKKKYPHLTWIADFRDIHVDVLKRNVLFPAFQHKMNRIMLHEADVVTTVSEGCRDHLIKYKPTVHVVRNGIFNQEESSRSQLAEKFTISYTGSLYGTMRDPSLFFEAIKELTSNKHVGDDIEIVYAGKDGDSWTNRIKEFELDSFFLNKGIVSYDESKKIQERSHINLQLTFSHPEVKGAITGKIMEYIRAKRPILCIINGVTDEEIENFFTDINQSIVVYNHVKYLEKIKAFIVTAYAAFKESNTHFFDVEQPLIDRLKWENVAKNIISLA